MWQHIPLSTTIALCLFAIITWPFAAAAAHSHCRLSRKRRVKSHAIIALCDTNNFTALHHHCHHCHCRLSPHYNVVLLLSDCVRRFGKIIFALGSLKKLMIFFEFKLNIVWAFAFVNC
ncbi:MAG: hypothetical protein MHMPM18_003299 [Marteilia pararefringens]